jgi:hypothetical protein
MKFNIGLGSALQGIYCITDTGVYGRRYLTDAHCFDVGCFAKILVAILYSIER